MSSTISSSWIFFFFYHVLKLRLPAPQLCTKTPGSFRSAGVCERSMLIIWQKCAGCELSQGCDWHYLHFTRIPKKLSSLTSVLKPASCSWLRACNHSPVCVFIICRGYFYFNPIFSSSCLSVLQLHGPIAAAVLCAVCCFALESFYDQLLSMARLSSFVCGNILCLLK